MLINTVLLTRDGRNIGNAIVQKALDDKFVIKTDYGNIVELTKKEIDDWFYIGEVAKSDHKNYVHPMKSLKALAVCCKCHYPVWANEVCSCTA